MGWFNNLSPEKRKEYFIKYNKRLKYLKPNKTKKASDLYLEIWDIVDGATRMTLNAHPEYVRDDMKSAFRQSLAKRITGQLESFVRNRTEN